MILVQELILSLRSRLRDEGIEKTNYSDNELLDCINMAYITLATRVKLFFENVEFDLSQDKPKLPKDGFALVNVMLDGRDIDVVPLAYFIQHKAKIDKLLASLRDNEIVLSKEITSGILKVDFNVMKKIARIEDSLDLAQYCKEAIIFYAMMLLLQKEARNDNLQKAQYYQQLFEIEIQKISLIQTEQTYHNLISEYQYV